MEKICDEIYIDNSKMLLLKLDKISEKLYFEKNEQFLHFLDMELENCDDYNSLSKIESIRPETATKAEFILSNNCNMNCIYCYSSAHRNNKRLHFSQAKAVIDRLISNSIVKNIKLGRKRKIYISFHGGGEPSCEFELLKKIVEYAQSVANKNKTELYIEITTNLSTVDDNILDFYIKNNFFVHISMDGIEKIQNYQRPYCDGMGSFDIVMRNIKYLSKKNALFSIRLTVTDYSIEYVSESVKLLKDKFRNVQFIKLAPLECTEKSSDSGIEAPDLMLYINKLEEVDKMLGSSGDYSVFGETDAIINRGMCASVRFEQIIVSPEGIITSCHENPTSELFCYGKVSEGGSITFDNNKIRILQNDRTRNVTDGQCSKCSFRNLCMGGCKHRMLTKDKSSFCYIERYSLTKIIKKMFDELNINNFNFRKIKFSLGKINCEVQIIILGGL